MKAGTAAPAALGGLAAMAASAIVLWGALFGDSALFGSDYLTLNYPILDWVQRAWREGRELPLWLPHLFGGIPLIGSMNSGFLYPTELVASVTGIAPPRFYAWNAWLHEGIAGAGAAWMLSREGLPRAAAVWGGAVYALGGLVFTQLGVADTFAHRAVAWLPWLAGALRGALGIHKSGCRPSFHGRGNSDQSRGDFVLAAFVLGLLWLTCAIQMVVFGAVFLALLLALDRPVPSGRAFAAAASVAVAGTVLGSALLLPALDYYRFCDRPEATEQFANLWAFHPLRLVGFLAPGIWGRTAVDTVYFGPYESDNTTVYPGLVPLAFGAWGLAVGWRRRLPWLAAGAAAFVLAFGGATPAGNLLQRFPVLGGFRGWTRWLLFTNLSFAVFAAEGWAALGERRRPRIPSLLLAVAAAAAVAAWAFRGPVTDTLLRSPRASERIASGAVARADAERTVRAALARAAVVAPVSLAVAAAAAWPAVPAAAAGLLAGVWSAADLVHAARPFLELRPAALLAVPDQVGEYLDAQDGLFRVVSGEGAAQKNLRIARDIHYVWGYHGVPPSALYRFGAALKRAGFPRGMLAVMNVRYYVTKEPFVAGDLRLVGGMRGPDGRVVYVHEFREHLPRLFFPGSSRVVADEEAALDAMVEPEWDWRTAVVSGRSARDAHWSPATASPLVLRPNEREAEVTARGPAFAVLSAVLYPGWLAFLDGERVPIIRTDALLLGVEVPAGVHHLVFRRDPRSFRIGLLLTCIAAAALAGGALSGTARAVAGFRRGTGPEPAA